MRIFVLILIIVGSLGYLASHNWSIDDATAEIVSLFDVSEREGSYKYSTKASLVPENVMNIYKTQNRLPQVFQGGDRVVFYVADPKKEDSAAFDAAVRAHVASLGNTYSIVTFSPPAYRTTMAGNTYNDICNSFEECKAMKDRASAYAEFSGFFDHCAKTLCVFNNRNGAYVRLKKKHVEDMKIVLTRYRAW